MKRRVLTFILITSLLVLTIGLVSCSGDIRCKDGHTWKTVSLEAPKGCLNDGQSYDRCSVCGIRRYVDIEPLGHDMVLVEGSGFAPTCLEAGYEGDFVCSRKDCGYQEKGAIIPAHGHKDENHDDICDICGNDNCQHIWGEWLDNGDGTHTRICTINENHTQKSEHNFDDGVITVFANCMNNGEIIYTCLDCGFERVDEYSEIRHSYPDNWTDNGNNHIKVCEYGCGENLVEGHNHIETGRTSATCENAEVITYECECGNIITENGQSALDHNYQWTDNEDGTCTGICANDNGHVISAQPHIDADNDYVCDNCLANLICDHQYDSGVVTVDATCFSEGVMTYTCVKCGTKRNETIDMLQHGYSIIEEIEADCVNSGTITYSCAGCGDTYYDIVAPLGHSYDSVITDPTCTEGGYTTYTCTECNYSYQDNRTGVKGHQYDMTITESTCTNKGYTTYTCKDCGHSYIDEEMPVADHTFEAVVTDPTCTEAGYTTHTCTVCGVFYTDNKIAASGHDYDNVIVAPTCTEAGYTTHTCKVCHYSYNGEYVDANGHTYKNVVTSPTCTEAGYTTHTCDVCGYELKSNSVPAKGHDYASEETITPDCENEGEMTYTCSRCGDVYTEVLSAIGHAYPLTWTENGEGVDGKHVKVCANDPSHVIEESHVFLGEETYYSKQVGTWTNASGTDTRALVDVFWGRYCEKCGWVHIHDVERTDTENNLVTDFDQLYRLLTYGYSVKLANDITVPATGNTAQKGSKETAGYKSVVINLGTFRGFSNPLVEIDLGEYTLSGLDGNTDALIKTNTPLIIDGTDGGAIMVDGVLLVNNGGSIVEFRGGTYVTEGNTIAELQASSSEEYSSRVEVHDATTTFVVLGDNPATFATKYPRSERMIAILDAGIFFNWNPEEAFAGDEYNPIWIRHLVEFDDTLVYEDEQGAYYVSPDHNFSTTEIITPATCEENGQGVKKCGCGYVSEDPAHLVVIPATGHDWGEWVSNNNGTSDRVCNNDESHVENRQFMIASSIGTNSSFPVYIYVLEDTLTEYSDVYVEIIKPIYDENGAVIEEKVTKLTTYTVSKNYYQGRNALRFTYSDINLYEMGVVFVKNVYADGILITSKEYSISEYVSKTIKNENIPAVLKKMLVDIVNLGSAEQLKEGYLVDNLVNSVLTDEERAFGTVGTPSIVDSSILTRGEEESIHIVGANIDLQTGVVANINFTIGNRSLDDFNIEISHTAYNGKQNVTLVDGATATKSGDVYSVAYSKLNFADLRCEIKIRFIDKATGETIGDQWTTSGESIMAQGFANGEDEATLNMYNALMIYADSKCEYNDYVQSQK